MIPVGPRSTTLEQFVEDELLRAPMLFHQLTDAVYNGTLKSAAGMQLRLSATDITASVWRDRQRLGDLFVESLTVQTQQALQSYLRTGQAQLQPSSRRLGGPLPGRLGALEPTLALVDDSAVAMDVTLAHLIETISVHAEHELRELHTFTSALVGDVDVARDTNPLKPEVYARALWAAISMARMQQAMQTAYLHQAAEPLAQLLRRSYAAACTRLESLGVEPAAYRTVVLPGGQRSSAKTVITISPDLQAVREALQAVPAAARMAGAGAPPAPAGADDWNRFPARGSAPGLPPGGPALPAARPPVAKPALPATAPARSPAVSTADPETSALIERLFAEMAQDRRMPADVQALVALHRRVALRLAGADPRLMDREGHPLWRFINQWVFAAEATPEPRDPERLRLLRHVKTQVDLMRADAALDNAAVGRVLDQLEAFLNARLARRIASAGSQMALLEKLERQAHREAPPAGPAPAPQAPLALTPQVAEALDETQLDTVPADLLEDEDHARPSPEAAQAWLAQRQPGDWVRLHLGGSWVRAQLLWVGPHRLIWLWGDGASDATWAIRRSALEMLFCAEQLRTLYVRSIVGSAAARVMDSTRKKVA